MEKDTTACSGGIMDVFDENILTEILLHLPMKLKFQCKAVCKGWLHLISSPYFADCVLAREEDRVSSMIWYLLYQYTQIGGCPFNFPENVSLLVASENNPEFAIQRFKFDFLSNGFLSNGERPLVYAAHNGLLLCSKLDNMCYWVPVNQLYVCNPLTGKWVSVPEPQVNRWKLIGFIVSYNNGSTKFKVVRRLYGGSNFEVFSSDVGQWKDTGVAYPDVGHEALSCVVHDGVLHWIARTDTSRSVIAYDLGKNKCRVFSLNVPFRVPYIVELLGTSCGHLCYVNYAFANYAYAEENELSVFFLENYETNEWRPLLITQISSVLDANKIHNDGKFTMRPMAFHPFDMNLIYFQIGSLFRATPRRMVSFNLRTQKFNFITEEYPRDFHVEWPIFLLVLPPWPTSVPQPIQETTLVSGNDDDDDDIHHDFGLGCLFS